MIQMEMVEKRKVEIKNRVDKECNYGSEVQPLKS